MDLQQYVNWFRHSSPYIHAHRGKTFVVLLPGEAVSSAQFTSITHDLALLNSLGVKLVLVHGARPQIEDRLNTSGLQTVIEQGWRVTDTESMEHVKSAVGQIRCDIEAQFSMGLPNSPMAGAQVRIVSGNLVTARPLGVREGIDFLHTGMVRKIDVVEIRRHLDENAIVLLSPLGYSPTSEAFNLHAEDVALAAATQLKADKLIVLSEQDGASNNNGELIHQLTLHDAASLPSNSGNDDYFNLAINACKGGVRRAHIINQQIDGALLLELFTHDGIGTLITADTYDTIRQASIDDVGGIIELIAPLEEAGVLVRRSRELLEMEISYFSVMERDGMIIACAALYPFEDDALGELACLAVHPDYHRQGRGDQLLTHVEQLAKQKGLTNLYVLTSQTAHWFKERGFNEEKIEKLPIKKQQLYNYQRKSKVFMKVLPQNRRISA
jgi:amino-acid N-acetyltransferase